jgi:ankyrin repeat protein
MEANSEKFCEACIAGDLALVHEMVRADVKLANCRGLVRPDHREYMKKFQSEGGWSPLHLAGHYGQVGIVKTLIEYGADINALSENGEGNTPLMAAIAGNRIEIVKELLESGADPFKSDAKGEFNALKLAEAGKKVDILALFQEQLRREGKSPPAS